MARLGLNAYIIAAFKDVSLSRENVSHERSDIERKGTEQVTGIERGDSWSMELVCGTVGD